MAEKFNLQDRFLNYVRTAKIEVKIYVLGGYQTSGYVRSFDNYTILIEKGRNQSLVYKHAINMIVPSKPVRLFQTVKKEGKGEEEEEQQQKE